MNSEKAMEQYVAWRKRLGYTCTIPSVARVAALGELNNDKPRVLHTNRASDQPGGRGLECLYPRSQSVEIMLTHSEQSEL